MKITCVCDSQSPRGKRLAPPPPSQNSLEEALLKVLVVSGGSRISARGGRPEIKGVAMKF